MNQLFVSCLALFAIACIEIGNPNVLAQESQYKKTHIIATTDGEIDDECSMVCFLMYANEWDIEGIVTTSSQYHWQGYEWAGDNWIELYFRAYEKVYRNLNVQNSEFTTPVHIREKPGEWGRLSAKAMTDPHDERLAYRWWRCLKAGTYDGRFAIRDSEKCDASSSVPANNKSDETIRIVCEVDDGGAPSLKGVSIRGNRNHLEILVTNERR